MNGRRHTDQDRLARIELILRAIHGEQQILWEGEKQIYRMQQRLLGKLDKAILDAREIKALSDKLKRGTDQLRSAVESHPLPTQE